MSRRIDIELTSAREDGTWTWRAAGARQPKGELTGDLLPGGTSTGDVLRADADFGIDGIEIIAVLPPKAPRAAPEVIELLAPSREEELVTSTRVTKERGRDGRDRGPRREGRDRDDRLPRGGREGRPSRGGKPGGGDRVGGDQRRDRPGDGAQREGAQREGAQQTERPRHDRPRSERPVPPVRPKPKRLRPNRTHRKAVVEALPAEQQPVAEQVLKGGIPAVRHAIDKQNTDARVAGHPEVGADAIVALAEQLLPALRTAEWRDRAEAAVEVVDDVDLRDLRSLVVAADAAARDDEAKALAANLREALGRRVESEQASWLEELTETLAGGRVVRALRVSSRPPKAGAPLSPELTTKLTNAAAASLTADVSADRWATVLDALSFSPVRLVVTPQSVPPEPSEELLAVIKKLAGRIPQIAQAFSIEAPTRDRRARSGSRKGSGRKPPAPADRPMRADGKKLPPPPPASSLPWAKENKERPPSAPPVTPAEREVTAAPPEQAPGVAPAVTAEPVPAADAVAPPAEPDVAPPSEAPEPDVAPGGADDQASGPGTFGPASGEHAGDVARLPVEPETAPVERAMPASSDMPLADEEQRPDGTGHGDAARDTPAPRPHADTPHEPPEGDRPPA
ncbi:hypothetical protein BH24ACT3_BH24ACT3_14590 [soil metagenome]